MDIEFDFKGDPLGGVINNCKYGLPDLFNRRGTSAKIGVRIRHVLFTIQVASLTYSHSFIDHSELQCC